MSTILIYLCAVLGAAIGIIFSLALDAIIGRWKKSKNIDKNVLTVPGDADILHITAPGQRASDAHALIDSLRDIRSIEVQGRTVEGTHGLRHDVTITILGTG